MQRLVRYVPGACVVLLGSALIVAYGVPPASLARYLLWVTYGVILPGTLIYRSLRGTPRSFIEDVCAGAALGYALQILLYVPARATGFPYFVVVWPAAVVVVFLRGKKLRGHLRPAYASQPPLSWMWWTAALIMVAFGWLAGVFFETSALSGPLAARPYVDFPYHLAVASEVKHHMPPQWSFVLGEPLHHHWFAHAEAAASSWATGLELRDILLRLQLFPMVAISMVLTAILGSRVARRWWPGIVSLLVVFFVAGASPYATDGSMFVDFRLLHHFVWQAPTQAVSMALFGPVPILAVDQFRRERASARVWVLITILLAGAMGSKSTVLPIFVAGMGFTGLISLIVHRRLSSVAVTGALIGSALFVIAYLVLYGASSYGLEFLPLGYIRRLPIVGASGLDRDDLSAVATLVLIGLALASWMGRGALSLGALRRSEDNRNGVHAFLLGGTLAGVALVLMFVHPGGSNVNFLRTALPLLGGLTASGVVALVPNKRIGLGGSIGMIVAASLGALLAHAVSEPVLNPVLFPKPGGVDFAVRPFVIVAAGVLLLGVAVALASSQLRWRQGAAPMLVLMTITGLGLPVSLDGLGEVRHPKSAEYYSLQFGVRSIPKGALEAARWLRDHSSPDDVVATNTHCRFIAKGGGCDNRHFWIAGYTERRILVEGWGYTAKVMDKPHFYYAPFWDSARLAANDRAFREPSPDTIDVLRRKYGVDWLFVDERFDTPSPELARHARLVFRSGPCTVYRV